MTRLEEQLSRARILLGVRAGDRREVLEELARMLGGNDEAAREAVRDDLLAREQLSTTAVGGGVAFPHARVEFLPAIRIAFLRTVERVDFGALDGKGVDLFLAIAGPKQGRREYLATLGKASYLFRSSAAREEFRKVSSPEEVLDLFGRLSPERAERS